MKPRRVFFLNRSYFPEETATAQLLTDLTSALVDRGFAITVITARSPLNATRSELLGGVHVERVPTTQWGQRHLAGRAVDFATFHLAAFWQLWRQARNGDVIVAMTDPPMLGVSAWVAASLRTAAVIHWIQDIYPEIAADLSGHRWLLLLRPLQRRAWRRAAACVVPGEDMMASVSASEAAGPVRRLSPNWAPNGLAPAPSHEVAALRAQWNLTGKFVVMYSGNLGRAHDLDTLLDVAQALRDEPDIAFVFVGRGARHAALTSTVRNRALANVHFFPPQPRGQLSVSLTLGDVHFVTLRPGAHRWVFPSKFYGITRVGRPVLFIGNVTSEIARRIRDEGLGETFAPDELGRVVDTLRSLRSAPGRRETIASAALRFNHDGFANAVSLWSHLLAAEPQPPPVRSDAPPQ